MRVRNVVADGSLEHFPGNIAAEFGNLFPDVSEESVTGPATKQHDGAHRNAVETHGHGGRGSNRVKSDVISGDAAGFVDGIDMGTE